MDQKPDPEAEPIKSPASGIGHLFDMLKTINSSPKTDNAKMVFNSTWVLF